LRGAGALSPLHGRKDPPGRNNSPLEAVYLVQVERNAKRSCAGKLKLSETTDFPDRPEKDKQMSSITKLVLGFTIAALMITAMFATAPKLLANPQQASTTEVKIDNFSFGPATLTVAPGTTVTWINHDDIPHTVVSTDGLFKSKVLDTDEKFSFTFTKAGNYPYFCSIHPKMTASVVVK
jgi:plastocyanin